MAGSVRATACTAGARACSCGVVAGGPPAKKASPACVCAPTSLAPTAPPPCLTRSGNVFYQPTAKADLPLVKGAWNWNTVGYITERGCMPSNSGCNDVLLARQNWFNNLSKGAPRVNPTTHLPLKKGNTGQYLGGLPRLWVPIPAFGAWAPGTTSGGGTIPAGTRANAVTSDKAGTSRADAATNAPGAWVAPA